MRQLSTNFSHDVGKTLLLPKHELPLPKVDDEKKNREDDEKSVTKSRHPRSSHQQRPPSIPAKATSTILRISQPVHLASQRIGSCRTPQSQEQTRADQKKKKSSMYYIPPKLLQEKKKPRSYANYISTPRKCHHPVSRKEVALSTGRTQRVRRPPPPFFWSLIVASESAQLLTPMPPSKPFHRIQRTSACGTLSGVACSRKSRPDEFWCAAIMLVQI
jgi:hypothetical protein